MQPEEQRGEDDLRPLGDDDAPRPDRRWSQRRGIDLDADLTDSTGFTLVARITEISEEGCRLRTSSAPALDRDLLQEIKITGLDPIGAYVIWISEDGAGFTFSTPLDPMTVRSLVTKSLYARLSRRIVPTQRDPDELGTLPPFPFED